MGFVLFSVQPRNLHWPDGVEDGGGVDWEPEMLGFLRDHPLEIETR